MSIWNYSDYFPSPPSQHQISLGEGNTPLIQSRSIGPSLGIQNLYFKLETTNPTGSFKDRFGAAAISNLQATENGPPLCLGTSSGNTGASLAAYSAAAGIRCILAIVDTAPQAKLSQMLSYGARLVRIRGFGTDPKCTQEIVSGLQKLANGLNSPCQISAYSYSPFGMAGVQTIALEIADQLPNGVDHVFSQAGGGGLTLAVARGFSSINHSASVHCVQPEGNDTIATPLRTGAIQAHPCQCTTKVSGLQVASVIDGHDTLTACRNSGGNGYTVEDDDVFEIQSRLAAEEGIFSEPAGAVSVAGVVRAAESEEINPESTIVSLVTGSGFKDTSSIDRMISDQEVPLADSFSDFESIVRDEH